MVAKDVLVDVFGELTGHKELAEAIRCGNGVGKAGSPLVADEYPRGFVTLEDYPDGIRGLRIFSFEPDGGKGGWVMEVTDDGPVELIWMCGNSAAPVADGHKEHFVSAVETLRLTKGWSLILTETYDRILELLIS